MGDHAGPRVRRALGRAMGDAGVAEGDRVLLVGPRAAPDAFAVAPAAGLTGHVIALEPEAIRRLAGERRRRREGWHGLAFVDGEPGRIPLPDGAVDVVLAPDHDTESLSAAAREELARVCRPGARLALAAPARAPRPARARARPARRVPAAA